MKKTITVIAMAMLITHFAAAQDNKPIQKTISVNGSAETTSDKLKGETCLNEVHNFGQCSD